jgi:hypothetical protein
VLWYRVIHTDEGTNGDVTEKLLNPVCPSPTQSLPIHNFTSTPPAGRYCSYLKTRPPSQSSTVPDTCPALPSSWDRYTVFQAMLASSYCDLNPCSKFGQNRATITETLRTELSAHFEPTGPQCLSERQTGSCARTLPFPSGFRGNRWTVRV